MDERDWQPHDGPAQATGHGMTGTGAPLVSVIVPSFNHARFLRECVDSVLAQDHTPLEVIVVDDGSTDGSLHILHSYGARITLLQQRGGRQARARNLGLAVARGALVAFLDSDDRYLPGRISAAVAAFHVAPGAAVVWADYRSIDAAGRLLDGGCEARGARAGHEGSEGLAARQGRDGHWAGHGDTSLDFARVLLAGNPICNATATVRRAVLDEIGGFDERVPRVCDGAAWYQIAARGHRFVHLDRTVLDYRLHGSNDSARFAAMTHDRDTALLSAAEAYVQRGLLAGSADLAWLRRVLVRQFAFRAAAWAQRALRPEGRPSAWRARAYEALGSSAGLRLFAALKSAKSWSLGRARAPARGPSP